MIVNDCFKFILINNDNTKNITVYIGLEDITNDIQFLKSLR